MTGFWRTWFNIWCYVMMGTALVFVGAGLPGLDGGVRLFYDVIQWPLGDPPRFEDPLMRASVAILGAVFLGFIAMIYVASRFADQIGGAAWRAITGVFLVWYVVDSFVSVTTGAPVNAISNTAIAATFLAPILGSGVLQDAPAARAA